MFRSVVTLLPSLLLTGCGLLPVYPTVVDDEPVTGRVVDENEEPVAGALVLVYTQKNSVWGPTRYRIRRHAITDAAGRFEIAPDPKLVSNAGTYGYGHGSAHFLVAHPDYSSLSLGGGNRDEYLDMRITLKVYPYSVKDDHACFDMDEKSCACVIRFLTTRRWSCAVDEAN